MSGAPPPPPPPPPIISTPPPTTDGVAAVFAQINQGGDVTKGLRKVPKEEMTHKNPTLRAGNTVSSGSSPVRATSPGLYLTSFSCEGQFICFCSGLPGKRPIRPAKPIALAGKKPSKLALEGNKWVVVSSTVRLYALCPSTFAFLQEFFEDDKNLVVESSSINQIVNIYGCKNSTVQVKGKVNAVTLGSSHAAYLMHYTCLIFK